MAMEDGAPVLPSRYIACLAWPRSKRSNGPCVWSHLVDLISGRYQLRGSLMAGPQSLDPASPRPKAGAQGSDLDHPGHEVTLQSSRWSSYYCPFERSSVRNVIRSYPPAHRVAMPRPGQHNRCAPRCRLSDWLTVLEPNAALRTASRICSHPTGRDATRHLGHRPLPKRPLRIQNDAANSCASGVTGPRARRRGPALSATVEPPSTVPKR